LLGGSESGVLSNSLFQKSKERTIVNKIRDYTNNYGFSIIEVLVVALIITILFTLMVPVYNSVKEKGRRTQCAANLKNWGTGFYLYTADNNGFLPPEGGTGTSTNGPNLWYNLVPSYMSHVAYSVYINQVGGFRNATIQNSIFNCPSKRYNRTPAESPGFYIGYSLNQWIDGSGSSDLANVTVANLQRASSTVLLFASYDNDGVNTWTGTITNNSSGTFMKAAQNEGFNTLFADGSVRFIRNTEVRNGSQWITNSPTLVWNPNYGADGW